MSFYDEFSGNSIDSNKWNINGDYLKPENGVSILREDAYLNGQGQLVLKGRHNADGTKSRGLIDTNGKFTQKFGYIGAKMNYKTGALWMMTGDEILVNNSAQDGTEIDIAEKWDPAFVHRGLIWDGYGADKKFAGNDDYSVDTSNGYHELGMSWQSNEYKFYTDGVEKWQSNAGGVSQQPGFVILGGNIINNVASNFTNIDYLHAYDAIDKVSFTYTYSSQPSSNYPDQNGSELNNSVFAPSSHTNSNWVGVSGANGGKFDISISTSTNLGQITLHTLKSGASGIYLPTSAEYTCGSITTQWTISQPTEDGLYQILLDGLPINCSNGTLKLFNGWWTFLSEIVLSQAKADPMPPTISITTPNNGATILPPSYSTISGTSVNFSATALDNNNVVGVQFKIDGVNLGAEDTSVPFTTTFNSWNYANGFHSLSAFARDASGNSTGAMNLIVSVSNTGTQPPPPPPPPAPTPTPTPVPPPPPPPPPPSPTPVPPPPPPPSPTPVPPPPPGPPPPPPSSGGGSGSPSPSPTPVPAPAPAPSTSITSDGVLIKDASAPAIYVMEYGKKRPFASWDAFVGFGYKTALVNIINTSNVSLGEPIYTSNQRHVRGSLVLYNSTVYYLGAQLKYGFPSAEVFYSWGRNFAEVVPANSYDTYLPDGPIVQMKQ